MFQHKESKTMMNIWVFDLSLAITMLAKAVRIGIRLPTYHHLNNQGKHVTSHKTCHIWFCLEMCKSVFLENVLLQE